MTTAGRSTYMRVRLWWILLFASALSAQVAPHLASADAPAPAPESFYVVDFTGGSNWKIVDVQPARGNGSLVRVIEVNHECGTYHVRSDHYAFENKTVEQLAGDADICGSEADLIRQVNAAKRKNTETSNTHQYAIAAQCGSQTVLHHLPWAVDLKLYLLQERAPRLAALWSLASTVQETKGGTLVAGGNSAQDAQEKHRQAEQAAIDLRGGNFDLAEPDLSARFPDRGKVRLSDLIPEVEEATAPGEDIPVVENMDSLQLEKFEKIRYPQMGRIAHIEGDVTLNVSVDRLTGASTVVVQSGHPILAQSAQEAVSKWVFRHPYAGPNPLSVTVHFAVHCPLMVETTVSKTKAKKKTRSKAKP